MFARCMDIYELIEHSLKMLETHNEGSHDFSKVPILSNKFRYTEAGAVCGYISPLIHSANKQEAIYDEHGLVLRENIIVMGDIVEDSFMVRENHHKTILRVGFLNADDPKPQDVTAFRNCYDLFVMGDGSICPINASLETIFNDEGS